MNYKNFYINITHREKYNWRVNVACSLLLPPVVKVLAAILTYSWFILFIYVSRQQNKKDVLMSCHICRACAQP